MGDQMFCGSDNYFKDDEYIVQTKVFVLILLIIIILILSIRFSVEWLIYKDYEPMKQKSPLLCILMINIASIQIVLYPTLFVYNYFTSSFSNSSLPFRVIWHSLNNILYFVYFIRTLRLHYAHKVHPSRSKTLIFSFFKNQFCLVAVVCIIIFIKAIFVTFKPKQVNFTTAVDFISENQYQKLINDELLFANKLICYNFGWMLVLLYSLFLQKDIAPLFSMKKQLILIISINLLLSLISLIIFSYNQGNYPFSTFCNYVKSYPLVEIIHNINLFLIIVISTVYPMRNKKMTHTMLPVGRVFDLVKTMRQFLIQDEFEEIFKNFLIYKDEKSNSNKHKQTLQLWRQIFQLLFEKQYLNQEKIDEIKILIKHIQETMNNNSINNIIYNLNTSLIGYQSMKQVQQTSKFVNSINTQMTELEDYLLKQLDKFYKNLYSQTKSYYLLKNTIIQNKQINVNMVLIGLSLMVDTEVQIFQYQDQL